ncbi:hypothetical protein DL764_009560 [Monosporascus ibericus]|uniref:Uncharacterized protein n=1 Tax=Monosporascus ibericus TaxID=155417 RepID=A0A4Q4SXG1_9PEZI|nr:hypothetical protein DL764_009560 [Monosporascus ibericus]
MGHCRPNLDHIVVCVSHQDRLVQFTLNKFLNNHGLVATIRASSHYDYEGMRKYLLAEIGLPSTEPLVFNGTQKVHRQNDLEILIIGIQMGITILPSLEGSALPVLILRSEPLANAGGDKPSHEFEVNDPDKIYDATPRQSPKRPIPISKDNIVEETVGTDNTVIERAITEADSGGSSQLTNRRRTEGGLQSFNPKVGEPQAKRRKIQPQLLAQVGPSRQCPQQKAAAYFRDAGLPSYDILHDERDSTSSCDDREFSFQRDSTPYRGHQIQVSHLLKRAANVRRRYPAARRPKKQTADSVAPLNDPFNDEVLPAYGESDQEYDSETWNEIREEENSRQRQSSNLASQEVIAILNEVVRNYETEWQNEKRSSLQYKELPTWRALHRSSVHNTVFGLTKKLRMLDDRIAVMRHEITANPWSAKDDLVRTVANLEPSIRDRLKTQWILKLANQNQRPESAAAPPPRRKRRVSPSLENAVGTDAEEDLTSGSDEEIPAARGSQETIGCTRVPDTGETHDARGPSQSKASLQEVLERYDETMRATLFDSVEGSVKGIPDNSIWQDLILPALELNSLPTSSLHSSDPTHMKSAYVAKHLIRLFDIYTRREILPVRPYNALHESDKARIKGNESQFSGFVRLLLSLRHTFASASPSIYSSERSQTDALPTNTSSPLRDPISTDLSSRVGRPQHKSETESQGLPYQPASRTTATMEQRPVEPKRVIDLSADDDAFPSYDAFTEPYNGGWVDAAWTGTCELFGCSVTATEVKIAGFKSSLNHYQAMCVFLLLTNPVREGVAGGLLADDMGLGKTIESLAVVVVRRRLLQSQDHVRDNPHRHLREDDQSTGTKCPSRHEHPDGLQCTCNRDGWAYKIVRKLYDLPAAIFMPPHLIDNWVDQVKEHLDFGVTSPIEDMKFMVNHDAWCNTQGKTKGNQKFVCRKDQVDSAARDERGCFEEYDNGSLVCYFASECIRGKGRFHDETAVGLVIMDEAHKYRGVSSPTAPFVFLDKMRRHVRGPVLLLAISGSLQALGPDAWRWAMTHFDETAAKQGWTHFSQHVHDWKSFANDENYIISRLHEMDNGKTKAELALRWERHGPLRRKVVQQIIVRRTAETLDHSGKPIVDFPPPNVKDRLCSMASKGSTWDAFRRTTASVQSWINDEYRARSQQYQKERRGTEPTKAAIEMELLRGHAKADAKGAECYGIICRAATFPTLTALWQDAKITAEQLMARNINELASAITTHLAASKYDNATVRSLFARSPLWKYRDKLKTESPKYQRLRHRITDMLGRGDEHIVVFALHPVSCYVTMMLLIEDFPDIQVMYIHASVPFNATREGDYHSRYAMVNELNSRHRPKVLITSYSISSVGLNLQAANWLTMLEEPNDPADKAQAPARVHRYGMGRGSDIEALRDERNLAEKYLIYKNNNRKVMENGMDWSMYENADHPRNDPPRQPDGK